MRPFPRRRAGEGGQARVLPLLEALGHAGTVSVNLNTHNKLLLMAPAYDRHGTVGFRCVADAV